MVYFISKENQDLLWNVAHKNTLISKYLQNMHQDDKYVWFRNIIGIFHDKYGSNDLTVQQLMKDEAPGKTQFMFRTLDSLNILLNMTYPVDTNDDNDDNDDDETKKNTVEDTTALLGGSLKDCMDFDTEVSELNRIYNFSYKSWVLEKYGKIWKKWVKYDK